MIDPSSITPQRLHAALRVLVQIQAQPMNYQQCKARAWDALDALAPEIAMLPGIEAVQRILLEDALP